MGEHVDAFGNAAQATNGRGPGQVTVKRVVADGAPEQAVQPDGQRVVAGRYRLRSVLGRGGMGLVWLADDELLQRPVALKQVLPGNALTDASRRAALRRALREARAAARVRHEGVVRIHDLIKQDGFPWIVMELLSGRTLEDAVTAEGPLSVTQVTHVGLHLLDVLRATHAAGIVHRDVKPANVYLCDDDRVVLTDYGIAATEGEDGGADDVFAGSPGYASPERLRGERPRPACDLFSLGATLCAAVEGKAPFTKIDLMGTITAVTEEPPPPLLRAGPLQPVIEGLLAKDPARRLNADQAGKVLRAARERRRD